VSLFMAERDKADVGCSTRGELKNGHKPKQRADLWRRKSEWLSCDQRTQVERMVTSTQTKLRLEIYQVW